MECNFVVGQKVVCVIGSRRHWSVRYPEVILPVEGQTYTIRDMIPHASGEIGIRLAEVVNPDLEIGMTYKDGSKEPMFSHVQFRPVVTRKTDISVFTKMLRDVHADA